MLLGNSCTITYCCPYFDICYRTPIVALVVQSLGLLFPASFYWLSGVESTSCSLYEPLSFHIGEVNEIFDHFHGVHMNHSVGIYFVEPYFASIVWLTYIWSGEYIELLSPYIWSLLLWNLLHAVHMNHLENSSENYNNLCTMPLRREGEHNQPGGRHESAMKSVPANGISSFYLHLRFIHSPLNQGQKRDVKCI